mgnify:CR=1 FL=1
MPRAIWSGAISFGLINIPVKLYSGVSQRTVRFNQLDPTNMARIRNQKVNAETGEPVDTSELVRGFEVSKGNYVVVTDDELAALQPRATHTIDLEEFVELDEVEVTEAARAVQRMQFLNKLLVEAQAIEADLEEAY